jgi:PAS domain S-box-containing protein
MSQPPHQILRNAAVAVHASSASPAWLFSSDGSRLLFANAAGAALLGTGSYSDTARFVVPTELAARIARSAAALQTGGKPRLERLRGLGTVFGQPLTCTCARIADSFGPALLVAATEPAGRELSLHERARYLLDGTGAAAAFSADGPLLYATPDTAGNIGSSTSLWDLGDEIETLRVGNGADALVLALFPANSRPITRGTGRDATTQPELLDLSPIAEAITAMTQVPPDRIGQDGAPHQTARVTGSESGSYQPGQRFPLRFFWETDAENRFTISTDAFLKLAGPRTRNLLGRFWGEISAKLALDPDGHVAHALVSRGTWSGIEVDWPVADGTIKVMLSGIPVSDSDKMFRGYRGLGVCPGIVDNDADRSIATLPDDISHPDPSNLAQPLPRQEHGIAAISDALDVEQPELPDATQRAEPTPVARTLLQTENVVPFPIIPAEPKIPALNSAERSAFRDLGGRLAARLKGADELARGLTKQNDLHDDWHPAPRIENDALPYEQPAELSPAALTEAPDEFAAQRPVLDALPIGLLIYRGSEFIYANRAFLTFSGHASLQAFGDHGGLDAMFVDFEGPADEDGVRRLRICASDDGAARATARIVTAPVDGENATVLVLQTDGEAENASSGTDSSEMAALLDIAADGVVTFDRDAVIVSATARAENLFGYEAGSLSGRPVCTLFAPESERIASIWIERLVRGEAARGTDARDIVGRRRQGGLVPVEMTMSRANAAGTRFYMLFRDMTRWKDTEREMISARQQAEKASAAKSEFLAKISHEMRTPLNAIIGFSEVMMEQRFGPLGNERYRDYLKDIATSGAHVVSLLNDLLDLSKIEAGKMELSLECIDVNQITQEAVAIMQAQASRSRVIVRTALAMNLPGVIADARSVRQIVLNLLSNSIKFTNTGGQVIVSTATGERGEVILRVRDTGIGMSEKDIEAALQPFRQLTTSSRTDANGTGLGLPLTKALVEANRARFSIKSAVNAGTLVEIAFPVTVASPKSA